MDEWWSPILGWVGSAPLFKLPSYTKQLGQNYFIMWSESPPSGGAQKNYHTYFIWSGFSPRGEAHKYQTTTFATLANQPKYCANRPNYKPTLPYRPYTRFPPVTHPRPSLPPIHPPTVPPQGRKFNRDLTHRCKTSPHKTRPNCSIKKRSSITKYDHTTKEPNDEGSEEQETITIVAQNVQSIKNKLADRDNIIHTILNKDIDFTGLTETWIPNGAELTTWLRSSILKKTHTLIADNLSTTNSSKSRQGRNTALIIKNKWLPYIQKIHRLAGYVTAVTMSIKGNEYLIASILIPSSPKSNVKGTSKVSNFIRRLVNAHSNAKIILVGDWNATNNPSMDRETGKQLILTRPDSTEPDIKLLKTLLILSNNPLVDIWRNNNPHETKYTNVMKHGGGLTPSKSRIDYFLISNNLCKETVNCWIDEEGILSPSSTHTSIGITIRVHLKRQSAPQLAQMIKAVKIDHDQCTDDDYANYTKQINADKNIIHIHRKLDTIQTTQTKINAYERQLASAMKKARDVQLPLISSSINASIQKNQENGKYKQCKPPRYLKDWIQAQKLMKMDTLTETDTQTLASLAQHWLDPASILEHPNHTDTARRIKAKINYEQRARQNRKIKQHTERRETKFIEDQKRHIDSIFERNNQWQGVTFVKKGTDIITDPQGIKKATMEHYRDIMTEDGTTRIAPAWAEEYTPRQHIQSDAFHTLMNKITEEELDQHLSELPNSKAPGPSGIGYDMFKIMQKGTGKDTVLRLFNNTLKTGLFPDFANNGTIFLLPKEDHWSGNLDKTRPITLLETFRKLLSKILTYRLTKIVDSTKALLGYNFGFRTGMSCNEPLTALKLCIDHANMTDTNLLVACLDIRKAYDTVPFTAVKEGLKRIHVPTSFITLLENMETSRMLDIITPHGKTATFHPGKGLPQGELMAPILWAIFYDPLLCKLQSMAKGYNLGNIHIPVVAFADDIHPITSSSNDMNDMLDTISSFLTQWKMEMSPVKSHILSNRNKTHLDFPTAEFILNGLPIQDVRDSTALTRILGVFWTMNGDYKASLQRAEEGLIQCIRFLERKAVPGQVAIHLINTVIIPKITYQLQLSNTPLAELAKLDTKLRALAKKKTYHLKNCKNVILTAPLAQYKMLELTSQLAKIQVTNTIVQIRSTHIVGKLMREAVVRASINYSRKESLLAFPAKLTSTIKRTNYIAHISQILLDNDIQIRNPGVMETVSNHFHWQVTAVNYNEHHKQWVKAKLATHSDITANTRSTTRKSIPFSQVALNTGRADLIQMAVTPKWYQEIIKVTCDYDQETLDNVDAIFKIKTRPNAQQPIQDEAHRIDTANDHIDMWTDGSLMDSNMGSAAMLWSHNIFTNKSALIKTVASKPPTGGESSTKAELWAILKGLQAIPDTTKVVIHTDSQVAISSIRLFQHAKSERQKLKINNLPIVTAIAGEIQRFHQPIDVRKVKAHSGIRKNELVDKEAKLATKLIEDKLWCSEDQKQNQEHYATLYEVDSPSCQYPSQWMKIRDRTDYNKSLTEYISATVNSIHPDSDINITETIHSACGGRHKINALDASADRERAFRIKIITKTLATKHELKRQGVKGVEDSQCESCKEAPEDFNHLWQCRVTINEILNIIERTGDLMESRRHESIAWKAIKELQSPGTQYLLDLIGMGNADFINSPEAKGIITSEMVAKFQSDTRIESQHGQWLRYTIDCWLTSFYEIIWSPRCKIVFDSKRAREREREKQNRIQKEAQKLLKAQKSTLKSLAKAAAQVVQTKQRHANRLKAKQACQRRNHDKHKAHAQNKRKAHDDDSDQEPCIIRITKARMDSTLTAPPSKPSRNITSNLSSNIITQQPTNNSTTHQINVPRKKRPPEPGEPTAPGANTKRIRIIWRGENDRSVDDIP